jgi:hypothetical protein
VEGGRNILLLIVQRQALVSDKQKKNPEATVLGERRESYFSPLYVLCAQVKVHLMASSASLSTTLPIKQQATEMNNELKLKYPL